MPRGVMNDVRSGVRLLVRQPGVSAVAILTTALGVGATTTLGSVAYGVAARPLPYANADRLVRAIREKDVETLQSVPRVGRKKAQQLVLDLADKLDDLTPEEGPGAAPSAPGTDHAVRALVSLGVAPPDAEKAVREAMAAGAGKGDLAALIRDALGRTRK